MFSTQPTPPHMLPTATPASYLDMRFELPERRYVGLLACQRDPLLFKYTTKVIRCDKKKQEPAAAAAPKKGKKVEAVAEPECWEIELEDTVYVIAELWLGRHALIHTVAQFVPGRRWSAFRRWPPRAERIRWHFARS